MFQCDLTSEEQQWIGRRVTLINKQCTPRYITTLLHEAIYRESPLAVISFLLKCSADANIRDCKNNTPLHLLARKYRKSPYSTAVRDLLLEAGAHIDSVNCKGVRSLESLMRTEFIENPLQHLTLQCLAAQAIYKSGMVVPEDNYPRILIEFIKLHSA